MILVTVIKSVMNLVIVAVILPILAKVIIIIIPDIYFIDLFFPAASNEPNTTTGNQIVTV